MEKRLTLSRKDWVFGGVCGGIAEYLDIDPTVVRLAFVILSLYGGMPGIPIYIILWMIMPYGE